jgi:nicotinamide-nucleotide amidase
MPSKSIERCSRLLTEKQLTLAFVESASGGILCGEFALIPGSGKVLLGGLVTYDGDLKEKLLGVPAEVLEKYTPESAEVTQAMAEGLKKMIPADIIIANTGLTTPGGSETPDKPVGTMFIHAIIKDAHVKLRKVYSGSPKEMILQNAQDVADLIIMHTASI